MASDAFKQALVNAGFSAAQMRALLQDDTDDDAEFEPLNPNVLTTGESTLNRYHSVSSSIATTSGRLLLTYFTARKTETISQVGAHVGGTAAGVTTFARLGVYEIDSDGAGTLVASTANDTTLFDTAFSPHTRNLTDSFTKTAGQRYAFGLLVAATTMPTLYGLGAIPTAATGAGVAAAPRLAGTLSSQADLPASFTDASLSVSGATPFLGYLLP